MYTCMYIYVNLNAGIHIELSLFSSHAINIFHIRTKYIPKLSEYIPSGLCFFLTAISVE